MDRTTVLIVGRGFESYGQVIAGEYMSKVQEAISAVRKALDELDKALEYEQVVCMKMTMDVALGDTDCCRKSIMERYIVA